MSNLDEFVRDRAAAWDELDHARGRRRNIAGELGPDGVRRLGAFYRATAADLAIARRRYPDDPVVSRLDTARATRPPGRVQHDLAHGIVSRVRLARILATRPRTAGVVVVAILLVAVPTVLAGYWAWRDPGPASGLVPSEYQSVTEPRQADQDLGLSVDQESAMASQIFTNNIGVAFFAFAGGLLFGLGTLYVLVQNGIMLGAVAGLAVGAGNGQAFFELVLAHGVLEMSCIVVAGYAGLRIAMAIIDPGTRRAAGRYATSRAPRSRSFSVRRRGSSSPDWSKVFSRPPGTG